MLGYFTHDKTINQMSIIPLDKTLIRQPFPIGLLCMAVGHATGSQIEIYHSDRQPLTCHLPLVEVPHKTASST